MPATYEPLLSDRTATAPRMRFDVIDARVAEKLSIPADQITDQVVADFLDVSRETISRWRHGHNRPGLTKLLDVARQLALRVDQFTTAAGE